MSRTTLGLLVIGQSPRPDLEAAFAHVLGNAADLRLMGALDHLDHDGIAAVAPRDDKDTLYTTLPDGRSVLISKAAVTEGMTRRLAELDQLGADVAVVCCTGRFPGLSASGVHFASDLLSGAVAGALPHGGRLGIFLPTAAQAAEGHKRWEREGRESVSVALSPDADDATIETAAREMATHAPDIVVHDCISYKPHARDLARAIHGQPTLLAVSVAARFAAELAGI